MEMVMMFLLMISIMLWAFGVPIALIVIAANLSGARKAQEYIAEAAYRIEAAHNTPWDVVAEPVEEE